MRRVRRLSPRRPGHPPHRKPEFPASRKASAIGTSDRNKKGSSHCLFLLRMTHLLQRISICVSLDSSFIPLLHRGNMQISSNVFIIAGGASGLGAATARMIVENGGKVVIADVQVDAGRQLAAELNGRFITCDVTSEADARAAVDEALAIGVLRGLVNCAGIAPAAKTVGKDGPHPLDLFQRVVDINLIGTFNMARIAADAMARMDPDGQGERGVIINTASVAAFDGQIGQAAYAASKAAVAGLTLPMARDLSRNGIRVMTIAPGIFETPMLLGMPQEVQDSLGRMVPFPPRLGKPAEYAQLAKAIIENVMLNGETIRLDGAIRMQPK
jgi:NAD(P)-dependent dehydrogenase (short-subunit alcohol dehydrogenase family)